jgi:O-methyltransferase domain/Dimerisation domain
MSEWWTYRPEDFLLFSPRVYWRMFELHNAALWPLQVLTLAAGLIIILLVAWRPRSSARWLALLPAILWIFVGWSFLWNRYAAIDGMSQRGPIAEVAGFSITSYITQSLWRIVMPDNKPAALQSLRPRQLIQMGSEVVSRTVYVAAKLGLADQLAAAPKSAAELAGPMQVHAQSLHRLMRTLASLGVLTEQSEQRFALTSLGEALKTGAPGSARSSLLVIGSAWQRSGWDNMVYSVQTGKPGFDKAQGVAFFDYLAHHPEDASLFSETMVGLHNQEPPAIAAAYDFSIFKTIVDVGGATGNMLAAVLAHHAGPRGVLFDRPHVVKDAPTLLSAKGVSDRVTIESGDFFQSVPTGADAYILSHIIHDWGEDQCLTILGHVRKAMNPAGRLLIVEMVLPPGDTAHPGKMLDMVMLVLTGGRERTESEYGSLLSKADLRLTRVVPTNSAASIVEAAVA